MEHRKAEEIRRAVRTNYGKVAQGQHRALHSCCSGETCCDSDQNADWRKTATDLGYTEKEIDQVPEGSNMGLGCGNPLALASLQPGETVLDLGSGGGFDCFLAARAVGENGHVIGVDMTADMVSKAREASERAGFGNVEFRLGEIEHLPVADESVDVILSNCVINLSPEKHKVFSEAFRVLKKGGRLTVADVVAISALPEEMRNDLDLRSGCIGGAEEVESIKELLHKTGFQDVRIEIVEGSDSTIAGWFPDKDLGSTLASARIEAVKPHQARV